MLKELVRRGERARAPTARSGLPVVDRCGPRGPDPPVAGPPVPAPTRSPTRTAGPLAEYRATAAELGQLVARLTAAAVARRGPGRSPARAEEPGDGTLAIERAPGRCDASSGKCGSDGPRANMARWSKAAGSESCPTAGGSSFSTTLALLHPHRRPVAAPVRAHRGDDREPVRAGGGRQRPPPEPAALGRRSGRWWRCIPASVRWLWTSAEGELNAVFQHGPS